MVWKWPDNLSHIAVLDPQDLHLFGISLLLIEDSKLVITLPIVPIMDVVLKVLLQWWHLKMVVYLSLHNSSVLRS